MAYNCEALEMAGKLHFILTTIIIIKNKFYINLV